MVVMPDFYRGAHCDPSIAEQSVLVDFLKNYTNLEKVDADLDKAVNFAKEKGAKSFGAIGTCWGTGQGRYLVKTKLFYYEISCIDSEESSCYEIIT